MDLSWHAQIAQSWFIPGQSLTDQGRFLLTKVGSLPTRRHSDYWAYGLAGKHKACLS